MNKKIIMKFLVICVLSLSAVFVSQGNVKVENCEFALESCLNAATTQQERNWCDGEYSLCIMRGGSGSGGGVNPDYCQDVYVQRQNCADYFGGTPYYWDCYNSIPHNSECLGYTPE